MTFLSAELQVMLGPKRAFAELKPRGGRWLYWRGPLRLLLIFCSAISLLVTREFSLHIVGSSAIYWSLLPLAEIVGLGVAERRWPKADMVDRFFSGNGPWMLFIVVFAACNSSAVAATPRSLDVWIAAALAVLLWSCWIDYRFFGSVRKLAVQRAVSWSLFLSIFAGSWIWTELVTRLGL